ncbi:MAG: energy transducer TonB [Campylobacterales bacterium]|nr:energy transducer TonB [Campylobacterales bacterium]
MTKDVRFFAASGFTHVVVIAAIMLLLNFHKEEEEIVLTLDFSQAMQTEQPQEQQPKQEQKVVQPPVQKNVENSIPTPTPVVSQQTPQPVAQPVVAQAQPQKQVTPKVDTDKEYLDFHLQAIRKLLAEHRRYPRNARVLGQEGDVEVSFRLNIDGSVEDVSIVKSSTFEALDNAARELITSTAKLFPRPPKTVRVRVPLKYALQ